MNFTKNSKILSFFVAITLTWAVVAQKMVRLCLLTTFLLMATSMSNQTSYANDVVNPSQAEAFALLKPICGEDNIQLNPQSEGQNFACGTCPAFTQFPNHFSPEYFTLETVSYGSFTQPGVREVVLDFFGCADRASSYGGSVLLRRDSQEWSVVRYDLGLRTHRCLNFSSRDSRNFLVCENRYSNHGGDSQWLSAIEFAKAKTNEIRLLSVDSNVGSGRPPYRETLFLNWNQQDMNKDGLLDLVVKVRDARAKTEPPNFDCEPYEACLLNPKIYQLVFLFNGKSFNPIPETAKVKPLLERR